MCVLNNVTNSYSFQYQQNFKSFPAESNNSSNDFNNKNIEETQNSNFLIKLLTHPSLIIIPLVPFVCCDIYRSFKEHSLKKQLENSAIKEEKLKEFNNNSLKKMGLALAITIIPIYFVTDYINQKYKDKNIAKAKKQIDDFNEKNNVDIKFACSQIDKKNINIIGGFSPISGQIHLPEKILEDIFNSTLRQKSIINHELIHAQQHILMACSENGINKINYICAKKASERISEKQKLKIQNIYQEIVNNNDNKYKNKITKINGYEINFVNYVTALYKVLYDENANPDNIPIIINKEFYEQAKLAKGKLTKEEENKAQLYLQAYEKYPAKIGFIETLNPFSSYRRNLLEKEAYGF